MSRLTFSPMKTEEEVNRNIEYRPHRIRHCLRHVKPHREAPQVHRIPPSSSHGPHLPRHPITFDWFFIRFCFIIILMSAHGLVPNYLPIEPFTFPPSALDKSDDVDHDEKDDGS